MKRWTYFAGALLGLLCAAAPPVSAAQITDIYVSGLRRTRPHVVEAPLQRFVGRYAEDIDLNEVHAVIGDLGVLELLAVEKRYDADGSGKTLALTVRERWSVFGMPFFSVTPRGWIVGGGVADTNAFGLRNMLAIAGAYGPNEWFVMPMFIATPNAVGDFGWMLASAFGSANMEHTDQAGETVLRRFSIFTINPRFGLSYSLTERMTLGIRLSYNYITLRNNENMINTPAANRIQSFAISPNIEMRSSAWDGFLRSENHLSLEYYYGIVFDADNVQRVSLRAAFNQTIVPGLRATARSGLIFSSQSATPFFESGPVFGINILSPSYSARSYAGLSLGLERYLFRFSLGTVSVAAAYQAVHSDGALLRNQFDHGPAATLQLYFSRLAIPGIGLGGAYNVRRNSFQFAFNIGMLF